MKFLSKVYKTISPFLKKLLDLIQPARKQVTKFIKKNKDQIAVILVAIPVVIIWILAVQKFFITPRAAKIKEVKNDAAYYFGGKSNYYNVKIGNRKNNEPRVEFSMDRNRSISFYPASARSGLVQPKLDNETVTFTDVYQNTDFNYKTTPSGIKEEIVVKKFNGISSYPFFLELKGVTPKYYTTTLAGGTFYDESGKYIFNFEKPFAVDAKGVRTDNVDIAIRKDTATDKLVALLVVDKSWLASPDRAYPVMIDPTIVYDTSSEFANGSLNRAYDTGSGASPNVTTYYQEISTNINTLALYHFGNGACTTDSSGNSYTLTANGGMACTTGGILGFQASGFAITPVSYSQTTLMDLAMTSGTIEAWINPANLSATQTIFYADSTNDTLLTLGTSGQINFSTSGSTNLATANSTVAISTWTHVAATWTAAGHKIYINGIEAASDSNTTTHSTQDYTSYIGVGSGGNTNPFSGSIDELNISRTDKAPEEIKLDAQRRPYSVYTSDVIDLTYALTWNSFTWTELGVTTEDGETLKDNTSLVAQWNFNSTSGTSATNDGGASTCGGTAANCNWTLANFASTGSQDAAVGSGWTANNKRWGAGALMMSSVATADSISISDPANNALDPNSSDFTIETWINTTENTALNLFSNNNNNSTNCTNNGWRLDQTAAGLPEIYFDTNGATAGCDAQITGTKAINDGNWHHLVVSITRGTGAYMYLDGVLIGSDTSVTSYSGITVTGTVYGPGTTAGWDGTIDSTRVYSRALSQNEIISNYQAGYVDLQTRVGTTTDANDGTWEAWRPTTAETQVASMNSDATNWGWDSSTTSTYIPAAKSDESNIKVEGTGSMKLIQGQPQTNANVVGLWHLDETGGTGAYLKDSTANANNGTPTGTTLVNGFVNKARSFNGSSDYISSSTVTNLPTGQGARTFSAWINMDNVNPGGVIMAENATSGQSFIFSINNVSGTTYLFTDGVNAGNNITISGTQIPSAKTWHHVAFTFNGTSTWVYYLDGAQAATNTFGTTINTNPNNFSIGRRSDGANTGTYFPGKVDEVKVDNVALSAEQISEAYRAGRDHYLNKTISSTDLSGATTSVPFYVASDRQGTFLAATAGESSYANYQPDANTIGLWHFDEQSGSGAYIKDSSGTGNNATPTSVTHVDGKIGKAKYFAGGNNYIIPTSAPGVSANGSWTYEMWVKFSTVTDGRYILDRTTATNNLISFLVSSNQLAFQTRYDDNTGLATTLSGITPSTNTWYHIVGIRNYNSSFLFYVNGQLVATITDSGSKALTAPIPKIGAHASSGVGTVGIIDEVRVSNAVRTADEIRQAYEVGLRTHPITIDFKAALNSGNLISSTSDTSFTIDATAYGASAMGSNLYLGDKIIVKENYDGTEYIAQGTVNAVTASTGAVTVASWDSGSTAPSGGFTTGATVFKWQREYFNVSKSLSTHRNAVTNLSLRITDGSQGANVWLDDFKYSTGNLTTPSGSTITSSTGNRYFQFRVIEASSDSNVSSSFTTVSLDYTSNQSPTTPTLDLPTNSATGQALLPVLKTTSTDSDGDYMRYKILLCTNSGMTQNCQTFDQTSSQTGWSGQNTQSNTAYTSGTQGIYTVQSALNPETTYYWKSYAIDPAGSNQWSSTQSSAYSFTTNVRPATPSLDSPSDGTLNSTLFPVIKTTTTDAESDYLRYKILLCTDSGMATGCQTFDQTSSQTGWSGQNTQSNTAYTSGTQATYTVQTELAQATVYYWKTYATDPGGSNLWSTTQTTPYSFTTGRYPSIPTLLFTEGVNNPTGVSDTTPEFSALCSDPNGGDVLNKYRIQVSTNQTFSSNVWDSGSNGTTMTNCTAGSRSSDISYAGTTLVLNGLRYFWRIKFWDAEGNEGPFSNETAVFTMADGTTGIITPKSCRVQETANDTSLTPVWSDDSTTETGYRIEKNTDGAGFSFLYNAAAGATSYQDTSISDGHTYQYRIRAEGASNSDWCTTNTLTLQLGTFEFKGLNIKGFNLR